MNWSARVLEVSRECHRLKNELITEFRANNIQARLTPSAARQVCLTGPPSEPVVLEIRRIRFEGLEPVLLLGDSEHVFTLSDVELISVTK